MSAYDELVGRLGARSNYVDWAFSRTDGLHGIRKLINPDGPEAAAAIRALEGERDTARHLLSLVSDYPAVEAARQSAEAKLEAVREALERIASMKTEPTYLGQESDFAAAVLASLDKEKAGA